MILKLKNRKKLSLVVEIRPSNDVCVFMKVGSDVCGFSTVCDNHWYTGGSSCVVVSGSFSQQFTLSQEVEDTSYRQRDLEGSWFIRSSWSSDTSALGCQPACSLCREKLHCLHRSPSALSYSLQKWKWKSPSCVWLCEPTDCSSSGSFFPWNSPGQNTGVGSHFLLQEIFRTQGLNPGLPQCRWILCCLSHQGSLNVLLYMPVKHTGPPASTPWVCVSLFHWLQRSSLNNHFYSLLVQALGTLQWENRSSPSWTHFPEWKTLRVLSWFSPVQHSATPWTLSMGFSSQEYWSGV